VGRMNDELKGPIPSRALADAVVEDYATAGIVSCRPDAPLEEVAFLMANNRVHAVVVIDDDAAEPPVIADADLISALASGRFDQLRAIDVAGKSAVSIGGDESLDRAAAVLAEQRVSHLVVRNRHRAPIGILSTLDLARAVGGNG
jgi:CBS domain-containing protein